MCPVFGWLYCVFLNLKVAPLEPLVCVPGVKRNLVFRVLRPGYKIYPGPRVGSCPSPRILRGVAKFARLTPRLTRLVQQLNWREHVVLVGLDDASIHDHLVQNEVGLLEIEHDVELTLRTCKQGWGSSSSSSSRQASARIQAG